MSGDLLLVADPGEAAHLPEGLRVVITGIGMVPAAVAATRAILAERPDRVINLGTAGSLTESITGLHFPSAVVNRDIDREGLRQLGFTPDDRIELSGSGPVLGTGDSVVTGGPRRDELIGRCELVDMEAYAIAWVCRELDVELVVMKYVSDFADDSALAWPEVVDRCAQALAAGYADFRPA